VLGKAKSTPSNCTLGVYNMVTSCLLKTCKATNDALQILKHGRLSVSVG
jgi:hypothetical protein